MDRNRLNREQSREQTRGRLLAAAERLFAERGVNGAAVEQIAERAGYSRGAFYGNFADKQELVLELQKRRTQQEEAEVAALRQRAGSFADLLEPLRQWNRERAVHLDEWLALRMELWLYALRHEEFRAHFAEREEIALTAIAGGVAHEMAEKGVTPPADLAFLALIVHALEDGLLIQRALTPEAIPPEVVVDAVDLLMRAWVALARQEEPTTDDSTAG